MAPDEIEILAQVKPARAWLGLKASRNSKPDVHHLEFSSSGMLRQSCELRDRHCGAKGQRTSAQTRSLPAGSKAGLRQPISVSPAHNSLRVAHVHETPLVFFQHKARQVAGRIPGRVYSDPIGANLWD